MFLSFVGSNVDEFFMVRVAGLKRQIEKSVMDTGPDGMSAAEQLRAIRASVIRLYRGAHECWSKELVPALESSGIRILSYANLTDEQRAVADSYFQEAVFPTLTPLAFDPGRPFPHISNLSLNLAVLLRAGEGEQHFARVKIPDTPAATGAIERSRRNRRAGRKRLKRNSPSSGLNSWSRRTWRRFFRAWKSSTRIRFMSRAMPTVKFKTWKQAICWSRWKKACGSAASLTWCAWKSMRRCRQPSSTFWSKTWNWNAMTFTS